ncbi:MAG TPA: ribulokinase, partial [Limnochordia bacterium]
SAVYEYRHGVIDAHLPGDERPLPPEFALQDPADYLRTLEHTIPAVLAEAGVAPSEVIGLGVACTACTLVPTTADGTPLCALPEFAREPHAWVKLWKHHAAQPEAVRMKEVASARNEAFLRRYGGNISPEWFFPKAWQILAEAPAVYAAAARLIEAGDWVVWQLTGTESRGACAAGYKAMWDKESGYPSPAFLEALDPRLGGIVAEKMQGRILPAGACAGRLTEAMAQRLGLAPGTAVAAALIDAHASVPAAAVTEPHRMVLVMGTSGCHLVMSAAEREIEGVCGVVADGILPGFYGYEAGQAALGDLFGWFVERATPAAYAEEARRRGIDVHQLLTERAAALRPGESGLLALDWWNGNRSILGDAELSGLIVGYTLGTEPEAVYRSLIEATAFGTVMIIDAFEAGGVPIEALHACGGLPDRNPLLMQIYADVTGRPIRVAATRYASALGAAIAAAVAAGEAAGGYADLAGAAARMARLQERAYRPDPGSQRVYGELYEEYRALHDAFGRRGRALMHRLRRMRAEAWQKGV